MLGVSNKRENRALRGIKRVISRFSEEVIIYRSNGAFYDRESMKYISKGREEKKANMAVFYRSKGDILEIDGRRIEADIKIYSKEKLNFTEDKEEQSDILKVRGQEYLLSYEDKRVEGDIFIYYAKKYKGRLTEQW